MSDAIIDSNAAAAAAAAATAAEAAKSAKAEATIPNPPKGADFDVIAAMHTALVAENNPAAEAFHKKHVLGFKGK